MHVRQYGFRHERSTADLTSVTTRVSTCSFIANHKSQFLTVWHEDFLHKLSNYVVGFSSTYLSILLKLLLAYPKDSCTNFTILNINNLLSSSFNSFHSYDEDSTLYVLNKRIFKPFWIGVQKSLYSSTFPRLSRSLSNKRSLAKQAIFHSCVSNSKTQPWASLSQEIPFSI